MTSRRSNSRDSDRVQTQTSSANVDRIRSGDVSGALTEVLREETPLPRPSTQGVKDPEGEKYVAHVKSSIPTGLEGRDRPPKKAKTNGSDRRPGVSGEVAVAKPFHWQFSHSKDCPITEYPDSVAHLAMEANNEFAATLEKRLQDVPRSDELYEIKKVVRELKLGLKMAQNRECANAAQLAAAEKLGDQAVSFEARLRVVSNERKSALEQISFLEAKVESSANKFSDDLRRETREAKRAMTDSYLDVLASLKEKWEKKKAATDCDARLREVMENIDLLKEIMSNNLLASDELSRLRAKEIELGSEVDVTATSDFSVGKLDLPQILEDLPEDFFDKVPSAADDAVRCSGDRFEDVLSRLLAELAATEDLISVLVSGQQLQLCDFMIREVWGGGVTSSGFSNARITSEISKQIFPSVWFLISSVALLFCSHEIMFQFRSGFPSLPFGGRYRRDREDHVSELVLMGYRTLLDGRFQFRSGFPSLPFGGRYRRDREDHVSELVLMGYRTLLDGRSLSRMDSIPGDRVVWW
ncbi:hypothetical protein F2Q68_00002498 [Brassica cretica]|uniref:Uncharacterized protein n=1 Tax=Brassica cretica TaxID=69181 RepID=A0A8S9J715_BRACR|nr:hypothetical protein F2Q68_00002498 [Brassica cretica]